MRISLTETKDEISEENKKIREEYLSYLLNSNHSETTIEKYRNDLDIFLCWNIKQGNLYFPQLKVSHFQSFLNQMANEKNSSTERIKRLKSALSSFSEYLEEKNIKDDDLPLYFNKVKRTKTPMGQSPKKKKEFSFEQCELIANKLLNENYIQEACLVMVACCSTLRKQELTRLRHSEFIYPKMHPAGFYTTGQLKVKGASKNKKKEIRYIWNKVDPWVKKFLEYKEKKQIESEYLFFRKKDGKYVQIGTSTLNSWIETIRSVSRNDDFILNSMRKSFGEEMKKNGVPRNTIQELFDIEEQSLNKYVKKSLPTFPNN